MRIHRKVKLKVVLRLGCLYTISIKKRGCVKALCKMLSILHSKFIILFQYIWSLRIGNYFKCHVVSGRVPPTSPLLLLRFPFWMKRGRGETAACREVRVSMAEGTGVWAAARSGEGLGSAPDRGCRPPFPTYWEY